MINYEQELNKEQLDVVFGGDGPCLVLAGAGSGKTRTITYRVAYLLEQGVNPEHILLVTFTNKAAKEMMDRVQLLTGGEIRLPWSGTFHHIAYRLLHRYAPLLGYKNNFTILDSEDSVGLMKLCLKQEGIDRKERRFPSANVLHSLVSYARNAEMTLEEVLDMKHPQWLDIVETLTRIAADYDQRKRDANAMDFDDLLVNLYLLLLKSESVRRKMSEQFQYVLVDEYQDTNKIQASIIRLFASHHRNILVVGDDAQSIYSFRAADIQNILSFSAQAGSGGGGEYPDAKIFRLETNYRSTPDILAVANDIIANNTNQYDKTLRSLQPSFLKPTVAPFADGMEEAGYIADQVLELRDEGVSLNDMAVLFRASFHSQSLELELTKRDIPYEYRGGVRFFERSHIKDALAYVRIFHNPNDVIAWSRVLNMQIGIGPVGAERIVAGVQELNMTIESDAGPLPNPPLIGEGDDDDSLPKRGGLGRGLINSISSTDLAQLGSELSARGQIGWTDFLQIWEKMASVEACTPAALLSAILDSKYVEYLENEYPDYRERVQDIEQMLVFADRIKDVQQFLAEVSLSEGVARAGATRAATQEKYDDEKLVLSTIHQAKGLEWEAVFVIHMSAGQFPSERASREPNGIEEERRLFYVAVTRAKKQLYLTYPLVGAFDSMLGGPSLFLEELTRDLVEYQSSVGGEGAAADGIIYVPEDEPFSSEPSQKRPRPSSFLRDVNVWQN